MVFKQCLKRNIIKFITFDKWQQQNQNGDGGCEVIHFVPHSSTKSCRFLLESIAPSVCCRLPSTTDCSRPGLWRDSPRPGSKEECQISTVREFKYWLIFKASVSLVFLWNADNYCKSQYFRGKCIFTAFFLNWHSWQGNCTQQGSRRGMVSLCWLLQLRGAPHSARARGARTLSPHPPSSAADNEIILPSHPRQCH